MVVACMVLVSALLFYRIDPVRPLLLDESNSPTEE
jgi:hypothetical protein